MGECPLPRDGLPARGSVLGILHRQQARRAFWQGFALFGWGYLALAFVPWPPDRTGLELPTSQLLGHIHARAGGVGGGPPGPVPGHGDRAGRPRKPSDDGAADLDIGSRKAASMFVAGDIRQFLLVGHCLFALLAGAPRFGNRPLVPSERSRRRLTSGRAASRSRPGSTIVVSRDPPFEMPTAAPGRAAVVDPTLRMGLRLWRRGRGRRSSRLRASDSRGDESRAFERVGLPAHDLLGLASLVADLLPLLGPRFVGLGDLAGGLVEVVGLAVAVGIDAEVDRGDRGVAGLGRAEGLGVPRPEALDEVVPEGAGVVAPGCVGLDERAGLPCSARRGRAAVELLRGDAEACSAVVEADRAGVAADDSPSWTSLHIVAETMTWQPSS